MIYLFLFFFFERAKKVKAFLYLDLGIAYILNYLLIFINIMFDPLQYTFFFGCIKKKCKRISRVLFYIDG